MAKFPLRSDSLGFIVFFGLLAALSGLSIDISLPALAIIGEGLSVTPETASLTITIFLAGLAVAPLAYGPLSDHYGRRPLLIMGCALFTFSSIGATISSTIEWMLFFRFLQGAGVGAGSTLSLSVVRDLFTGARARTLLSYIAIVRLLGPMTAPSIGALILTLGHWRWIYGFLAICGLMLTVIMVLRVGESAPKFTKPDSYKRVPLRASYKIVLKNPIYLGYTAIVAFGFASQFSFVTGSPLIMMQSLGLSARAFGFVFALSALGVMLASFTNGQMSFRGVHHSKILLMGLCMALGSSIMLSLLTLVGWATPATLMPFVIMHSFSYGLIAPNAQQNALQPLGNVAGTAAALLSGVTMLAGAMGSFVASMLFGYFDIVGITGVMVVFCMISLLIYLMMSKKKWLLDEIE